MSGVPLVYYLGLSGILFLLGLLGVMVRRNPLLLLLAVELMLNGANVALIGFSRYWNNSDGQIFALVVMVVAAENTPENRVSPGERYARIYEINMARCIFCGYCEVACPFDAITLEGEYELAEAGRTPLIYTKEMLLAPHPKPVPRRPPPE